MLATPRIHLIYAVLDCDFLKKRMEQLTEINTCAYPIHDEDRPCQMWHDASMHEVECPRCQRLVLFDVSRCRKTRQKSKPRACKHRSMGGERVERLMHCHSVQSDSRRFLPLLRSRRFFFKEFSPIIVIVAVFGWLFIV